MSGIIHEYIAVDAMGGDHGLDVIIPGVIEALNEVDDLLVAVYGNKQRIERVLEEIDISQGIVERLKIINTDDTNNIPQNTKVTKRDQIRGEGNYADSSMVKPLHDLMNPEENISAVLSAGNTASFAFSVTTLCKKILKVKGPIALMITSPNLGNTRGNSVVLDVGADVGKNKDASKISKKILEDAMMAYMYAKSTLGIKEPSIGLLNVGDESDKGNDATLGAYVLLEKYFGSNFKGNIEPNNICNNQCDIIVTDGFTGNIALKSVEGIIRIFEQLIRKAVDSAGTIPRIGAKLCKNSIIKAPFDFFNPDKNPAGIFLGFEQAVAKVHGDADYLGFKNGIIQLYHHRNQLRKQGMIESTRHGLDSLRGVLEKKEEA